MTTVTVGQENTTATDLGPGTGQMLSTYLVEVGEPLATFVDVGSPPAGAAIASS